MIRRRTSLLAALALVLACGAFAAGPARAAGGSGGSPGRVLVVRLDGAVSPAMQDVLERALDRASATHARALVLEVDTPGGLESSMRSMIQRILVSDVPVIGWVAPRGAHAASAGVFVVMACDVAAMSPGTNIGAATPISLNGPMDSTLARKATNDAAAFARTVAAQRGRNVRWAERAVREAIAASETEAVRDSVVDFVADSLGAVLRLADGRHWHGEAGGGRIATAGCTIERMEPGIRARVMGHLADPNIAYLLMMLGFYGLIFELQNPGSILPGIVGGICLLLAFFALSALPVNATGVALMVLGIGFLLAEIKVHSHGMLAVGGAIALGLGGLLLFRAGSVHVAWPLLAAGTLTTVAFFVFVLGAAFAARRLPVSNARGGLAGRDAVVVERLAPAGRVRIGDEIWNATASSVIEAGDRVVIDGVEGLTLRVRPAHQEGR